MYSTFIFINISCVLVEVKPYHHMYLSVLFWVIAAVKLLRVLGVGIYGFYLFYRGGETRNEKR